MSVPATRFVDMGQRSDRFDVQVSVGDQVVEVRATGDVDIATVGALRSALWSAPARPVLRLDLSGVRLLSAAGVRALIAAHLRVRARGGVLVLVDPDPMVDRVLRFSGLHRVMPVVSGATDETPAPEGRPGVPGPRPETPGVVATPAVIRARNAPPGVARTREKAPPVDRPVHGVPGLLGSLSVLPAGMPALTAV
jgi:anti-sigma B factor antagonist